MRYSLNNALLSLPFLSLCFAACAESGMPTEPLAPDPTAVYWRMKLNHRAVTLSTYAPWDTVTLSAIPMTYTGDILSSDSIVVTYASSDSNAVSVTPRGAIRAKGATNLARIFVSLRYGKLTYYDTVFVRAVNNPAPKTLQTLSIHPTPPDSAKTSFTNWFFTLEAFLKRPAVEGGEMTEILIDYQSQDQLNVPFDRQGGTLLEQFSSYPVRKIGPIKIVASTYAYGVSKSDTLELTIGHALWTDMFFNVQNATNGAGIETFATGGTERTIGVGGEVTFMNGAPHDINIIFDDTTHIRVVDNGLGVDEPVNRALAGTANTEVNPLYYGNMVRRFTAPGIYTFGTDQPGLSGAIRVVDERIATRSSIQTAVQPSVR